MRYIFLIIGFLTSVYSFGQYPVVDKVANGVCEKLQMNDFPLEELNSFGAKSLVGMVIISNKSDWDSQLERYKLETGGDNYEFDQYLWHRLLTLCKEFRIVDEKIDSYLENKGELRQLYLNTKEFVLLIEDGCANDSLSKFFDKSLLGLQPETLDSIKMAVAACKENSILNILHIYVNGYTFRVRYFDFITGEPEFLIDVNYSNAEDKLIDDLQIRNKRELLKDMEELREFNEKLERGEIDLPPPPPPPGE